jgi:hypothetical protein
MTCCLEPFCLVSASVVVSLLGPASIITPNRLAPDLFDRVADVNPSVVIPTPSLQHQ